MIISKGDRVLWPYRQMKPLSAIKDMVVCRWCTAGKFNKYTYKSLDPFRRYGLPQVTSRWVHTSIMCILSTLQTNQLCMIRLRSCNTSSTFYFSFNKARFYYFIHPTVHSVFRYLRKPFFWTQALILSILYFQFTILFNNWKMNWFISISITSYNCHVTVILLKIHAILQHNFPFPSILCHFSSIRLLSQTVI